MEWWKRWYRRERKVVDRIYFDGIGHREVSLFISVVLSPYHVTFVDV